MLKKNVWFLLGVVLNFSLISAEEDSANIANLNNTSENVIDISVNLDEEEKANFEKIINLLMIKIKNSLEQEFSEFEITEDGKILEKILEKLKIAMFYKLNLSFMKDELMDNSDEN